MKYLRSVILILAVLMLAIAAAGSDASPQDIEALMAEGERQAQAGNLEAALHAYKTALADSPQSKDVRLKLAGMQVLNGQYRTSIEHFQRVISQDPDNANAFVGMGIAYLHIGDFALARAALQEASKHDKKKREELRKVLDWIENRIGRDAPSLQDNKPAFE